MLFLRIVSLFRVYTYRIFFFFFFNSDGYRINRVEIRIERKIKKKRKFEWKLAEFRFVETCVARLTESRQSARSNTRYNNAANKHERRETDEFAMKSEFRYFPEHVFPR